MISGGNQLLLVWGGILLIYVTFRGGTCTARDVLLRWYDWIIICCSWLKFRDMCAYVICNSVLYRRNCVFLGWGGIVVMCVGGHIDAPTVGDVIARCNG